MSSTTISSSNFQLIVKALEDYAKQTGIDLTKNPFANKLQTCDSSNAVLDLLKDKAKEFKDYRDGNRELINWLSPVVKVVHTFSDVLGEAINLSPFQPAKAIFVGINALLGAASGVSASYDALVDLFECIGNFLKRLHIYTEIPFTPAMTDVIVKIMIETLSVLALATKQIKQGRLKKFAKKLLGESEIEAVLQRLDRLTQEEARVTVAQTLEVVHGLVNNLKVVMDDGRASADGMRQALITMQETANDVNKIKRDQLQRDIRSWLSPPDPSKNHNIARRDHHDGTAAWFTRGSTFEKWKTAGSLLWIYGKPGSGKSILCSTIIQEAKGLRDAGLALMAYFYFDFRDTAKQDLRGLLSSLLAQLCAKSDPCYDILSDLYSTHDAGSQQPDDRALTKCLVNMLKLPGQPQTYVIVDALDECPITSGMVSSRERVLNLLEDFVELDLPNLRICVTSRPEADIRDVLEPLASYHVSLHDESGQKQDIVDYVSSAVYLDRKMRRWRAEDKELVIRTISKKADGMFRWVVCQLETLRRSFPTAIRRALEELPETLDDTYERSLLGIEKEKREFAHRLFQCLTVSVRPLRVEELADVLAVQFDTEEHPQYHVDWRPEDAQDAVLSACSSLVAVVNVDGSPVVQFSHFSVKEFLTSGRLATSEENLSRYHVDLQTAHTILAQVSLSILLQLDDKVDRKRVKNVPLATYAARHWVDHSRFGNVSSSIQDIMERLFDAKEPYFATWIWIYDLDRPWVGNMPSMQPTAPTAVPLYYATLCGFRNLVKHLIVNCPQDVNSKGGYYATPLNAALAKGDTDIALSLLENGANINTLDNNDLSPLHRASKSGRHDIAQLLLEHHADINIRTGKLETPLHLASRWGELEVVQLLVRHGADLQSHDNKGWTPMRIASRWGHLDIVRLLLDGGASVDSREKHGLNSIHTASLHGHSDIVKLLLERGVDVNTKNESEETPLDVASGNGKLEVARLLIEHGADINTRDIKGWSPLHTAARNGHLDLANLLVERGADVDMGNKDEGTPLNLASGSGKLEICRFLIEHGANVNTRDNKGWTPMKIASRWGHLDVVRLLLDSGASVDSRDNKDSTPLKSASRWGHLVVVRLLLDSGAAVDSRDEDGWTPIHAASLSGNQDIVKLLLERGVDVNTQNGNEETPLDIASGNGNLEVARLLIEHGADVNVRDDKGWSPLHTAARNGHLDVVKLLVERGADANVRNKDEKTPLDLASRRGTPEMVGFLAERMTNIHSRVNVGPTLSGTAPDNTRPDVAQSSLGREESTSLHSASKDGDLDTVRSLLDSGVDANARNSKYETPLDVASSKGKVEVVKLLIERGADVNCRDGIGWTPLHDASRFGHLDVVRLLLDHDVEVDATQQNYQTPLHMASSNGHLEIVQLLLERGANVHLRNGDGRTPSQLASVRGYRKVVRLISEYGALARGA